MKNEQYEHWKDFSLRMARTCFGYLRTRPSREWVIEQVEEYFWWRDHQKDWPEITDWDSGPYYVCDRMSEWWDDVEPFFQCPACSHNDCRRSWPFYEHSCPMCDQECRCDEIDMIAHEQWQDQWASPVQCCIRAGLDMASEPSAGVIGFTAGDLRRMYPEGVPEWVFPPDERLRYWLTDELNGTFAELPDEAGIVL